MADERRPPTSDPQRDAVPDRGTDSRWGTEEHTADLALWAEADTLEELLATCVVSLAEIMVSGTREGFIEWVPLELEGADQVELLVALLNESIYLLEVQELIAVALKVRDLGATRLTARLGVIPFAKETHQVVEVVKAATLHQARLEQTAPQRWSAHVVLDV